MPRRFLSATWITTGRSTTRVVKRLFLTTLAANLAQAAELSPFSAAATTTPPAPWHFIGLPERYAKPPTQFDVVELDGKKVLRVRTEKSYGNLAHTYAGVVNTIAFSWRLDVPLLTANLKSKAADDAALKVCVAFDMPMDKVPFNERAKLRFAQLFSKEHLPTATVCYVWAHAEAVGTDFDNPFSGRVHYIVLNTGESQLKTWKTHQRSLSADFLKAFGNETSVVPPITAIIVGADSDNTQANSLGYVTDIVLQP